MKFRVRDGGQARDLLATLHGMGGSGPVVFDVSDCAGGVPLGLGKCLVCSGDLFYLYAGRSFSCKGCGGELSILIEVILHYSGGGR